MSEAEVSLRLAFWLLDNHIASGTVEVAVDGAQVRLGDADYFDIGDFMVRYGWQRRNRNRGWQTEWLKPSAASTLRIHSNTERGDVVTSVKSGHTLRVKCKKDPLGPSHRFAEYPLLREALGEVLTFANVNDGDLVGVAVPHSKRFSELAERWRKAPLISRLGILLLTIDHSGDVFGFPVAS